MKKTYDKSRPKGWASKATTDDEGQEQTDSFSPGLISEMTWQKKNKDRVNIFIDGKYAMSCHMDCVIAFTLKKGLLIDEGLHGDIIDLDAQKTAYSYGLKACLLRGYTVSQLSSKLLEKGYSEAVKAQTIERLSEEGYLNDLEYAVRYIESRRVRYGIHRLKQGMKLKGLSTATIEAAFESFEAERSEADHTEEEALRSLAQKKLRECEGLAPDKTYQRVVGFLQRRGYGYNEIKRVLKAIQEEEA